MFGIQKNFFMVYNKHVKKKERKRKMRQKWKI